MRRQIAAYLAAQTDPKKTTKDLLAATFHCNRRTVQRVRVALGQSLDPTDQADLFEKPPRPV